VVGRQRVQQGGQVVPGAGADVDHQAGPVARERRRPIDHGRGDHVQVAGGEQVGPGRHHLRRVRAGRGAGGEQVGVPLPGEVERVAGAAPQRARLVGQRAAAHRTAQLLADHSAEHRRLATSAD
jgi:hypothetical protein